MTDDGRLFVPYALPGETVEIEREGNRGRLTRVVVPSLDRVEPVSPHYGVCGGCSLQHLALGAYHAWKRDVVVTSLRLHGIEAEVEPIVPVAPGTRRRAVFSAVKTTGGVILGFNQRGSDEIVPLAACPVLLPAIVARLAHLRDIAQVALKPRKRARMTVLSADNGLDIAIAGGGRLEAAQLAELGGFGGDGAIARLTVDDTVVFQNRAPELAAGGITLVPPPGGFVQAVASAEVAMAGAVLAHAAGAGRVADLFAGIGTFT